MLKTMPPEEDTRHKGSLEQYPSVAVLIPCFNEAPTIEKVIADFRAVLPQAKIYVIDNNSTDNTVDIAQAAGAIVGREPRQGKGHVVRRMFERIEADIYLMVDGDDTYPAQSAPQLIRPILSGDADMTVGDRLSNKSYHKFARRGTMGSLGNLLFTNWVNLLFGGAIKDVFSGYRAFSRKFVKSIPILSTGFQVEVEMTLFALDKGLRIIEVPIIFQERPAGSFSKLNSLRDGLHILVKILQICMNFKPFLFYGIIAIIFALASLLLGVPVVIEFFQTGLVLRFPTAILAATLMTIGMISLTIGLILNTIIVHARAAYELEFKKHARPIQQDSP
jgi:glycosyltransferase involved in cell wall biosynthesis